MNSKELDFEYNETLRKIGRNVLYFQRMEAMLKFIISRSRLEGTANTLKTEHENNIETISEHTMGMLVKSFFETVYEKDGNESQNSEEIDEAWFSISFRIEEDEAVTEKRKMDLKHIVEERNVLIHQMLSNFKQESVESCRKLCERLDEQLEKLKPEYENLRALIKTIISGRKDAVEALAREFSGSKPMG